jgi:glycosyltransferase involved in cell wall biosynthesis
MRILYFYQYFSTPKGSWGTRVYEFAKEWVKQGHEVTVISSIYSKSDLKAKRFVEDQYFENIHVKVLNISIDNKQSFIKRVWSFIAYSVVASYFALKLRADVVIASSGPITVGLPGLMAKYFKRRKLIFETRDLWPEGAIELGVIKNSLIKKFAYWFEKKCYKASSFIITLSPGMTQHLKKRFELSKIDDVTNAANIQLFSTPVDFKSDIVKAKSYAIYTGNIGMVNNSYWLYNAAKVLKEKNREDIIILLIGEGQQAGELDKLSKEENVENFIHLSLIPKSELVFYVQNAFVSLVPLKGTPVLDTSSPNKFFESLAAGVPVIQNTQGWMKDFLIEHEVGFTLDPNDPNQLANKLIWMHDNPQIVSEMGKKGLITAQNFFDTSYLANKMLNIIKQVHESN